MDIETIIFIAILAFTIVGLGAVIADWIYRRVRKVILPAPSSACRRNCYDTPEID